MGSDPGNVWEECLERQVGCRFDKKLCGEAQNPFYSTNSQVCRESSTRAGGVGVEDGDQSEMDIQTETHATIEKDKSQHLTFSPSSLSQLSQFIWSACRGRLCCFMTTGAQRISTCHRHVHKHSCSALLSLWWLGEQSVWASREVCIWLFCAEGGWHWSTGDGSNKAFLTGIQYIKFWQVPYLCAPRAYTQSSVFLITPFATVFN